MIKRLVLWLIRMYQKHLSKLKGLPTCRFYPTCSSYAFQAIDRFGVWKGGLLALRRILRCHPFNPGGIDPVPETFRWFKKEKKD